MDEYKLIKNDFERVKKEILSVGDISRNDSFHKDISEYLNAPSKYIRSIICLLLTKAMNKQITQEIYYAATAIELAHNASLLHDDVIDDAKIRRSQISFNKKTTSKTAILAGDWLLAQTMSLLNKIANPVLYKELTQAFANMTLGELQEFYDRFKMPTIEQYFQKNDQKTGELFKLASAVPFIIHNDTQQNIDQAKQFGKHFANAFQIKDDMVNYFGLNDNKPTKNDKELGIYTLPDIIEAQNGSANLYEESCQILKHQVNLCLKSLDFLDNNEFKDAIISLCHNTLLKGI